MERIRNFREVYRAFGQKGGLMAKFGKRGNLRKKSAADLDKSRLYNRGRLEKVLDFLHRRKGGIELEGLLSKSYSPDSPEAATELHDPEVSRIINYLSKGGESLGRILRVRQDVNERLEEQEEKLRKEITRYSEKYHPPWSADYALMVLSHPSLECGVCHPWIQMLSDGDAVHKASEVRLNFQYERAQLLDEIRRTGKRAYKLLRNRSEKIIKLHQTVEKEEFDDMYERGLLNSMFDVICPHPEHDTIEKIARCPNVQYIERAIESYA